MSKGYNTEGKTRLVNFLKSNPDMHFSVEEICRELNGDLAGRSSVYRNLNTLCEDGDVRRFHGQSGFVYQYIGGRDCSDHFHLKCVRCERLIHLECEMGDELTRHITAHHGFTVDSGRSILYGVCNACAGK